MRPDFYVSYSLYRWYRRMARIEAQEQFRDFFYGEGMVG